LLLKREFPLKCCKPNGLDEQVIPLLCETAASIPDGNWLPNSSPVPTIYVPEDKDYPIADFLLFDKPHKRVVVFQLTTKPSLLGSKMPPSLLGSKMPSANPYNAIYDELMWLGDKDRNVPPLSRKYQQPVPGTNFAEALLSELGVNQPRVTYDTTTGELNGTTSQDGHQQFFYIIVTPMDLAKDQTQQDAATKFPWALIMHRPYLIELLGSELVEGLSKV